MQKKTQLDKLILPTNSNIQGWGEPWGPKQNPFIPKEVNPLTRLENNSNEIGKIITAQLELFDE